jgi:hypothetical protein
MAAGFEHRAVGCHDVNAHSSRSHCLLIVNVNVRAFPDSHILKPTYKLDS